MFKHAITWRGEVFALDDDDNIWRIGLLPTDAEIFKLKQCEIIGKYVHAVMELINGHSMLAQ